MVHFYSVKAEVNGFSFQLDGAFTSNWIEKCEDFVDISKDITKSYVFPKLQEKLPDISIDDVSFLFTAFNPL